MIEFVHARRLVALAAAVVALAAVAVGGAMGASTQQVIVNGSFENGLTGWTTLDTQAADLCGPVQAVPAGFVCWFFPVAPTDGTFALDVPFDGTGGTVAVWQDISLPAAAPQTVVKATLGFDWRAGWDLTYGGTLDRTFDLVIEPGGGGTPLQTSNVFTAKMGTTNYDNGGATATFDLSGYAGQTIRVVLQTTIPQPYTGPAQLQVDNVSLVTTTYTKDDCKNGGWTTLLGMGFKNQGQCVSWFATNFRH
jgi:hypothetical protein